MAPGTDGDRRTACALGAGIITARLSLSLFRAAVLSESALVSVILYLAYVLLLILLVGALSTTRSVTNLNTRTPASAGAVVRGLRAFQSFAVFCWMFVRLVLFACVLLPAFLNIGWGYFWSSDIRRSIPYGKKSLRQTLDVYVPTSPSKEDQTDAKCQRGANEKFPVLVFVGGGAWVVGHRAFCALLGKIFMSRGILVIAPDYRQFPQVHASDMLKDVDAAIQWAFDHCAEYGGDADRIFIAGQSAGAHLTSTLLLEHARSEYREHVQSNKSSMSHLGAIAEEDAEEDASEDGAAIGNSNCRQAPELSGTSAHNQSFRARDISCQPWKCSHVAGYAGISGPYHLPALRQHLFERGIEQLSFLTHIIGGKETSALKDSERNFALQQQSPALRLRSDTFKEMGRQTYAEKLMPPILLVHGDADNVVPKQSTKSFAKSLQKVGVKDIRVKYLKGASHTDPIIEDLLFDESGGDDAGAISELLALIHQQTRMTASGTYSSGVGQPMRPEGLQEGRRKVRSPSMISDGFGFVTDERGRAPVGCASFVPRLMIRVARAVNPF